jgi:hypothetical protein
MRRMATILGPVLLALGTLIPASAQTTGLIGGGLTALPTVSLGPDLLKNGAFDNDERKRSNLLDYGHRLGRRSAGAPRGQFQLSGYRRVPVFLAERRCEEGHLQALWLGPHRGNRKRTTQGVRLQFDRRPTANEWKTTDVISGTRDWNLFELPNLVVTADATISIRVENYNNSTGTVWFDDVKLEEQQSQGVEVFMLYPNFRGMLFDDHR